MDIYGIGQSIRAELTLRLMEKGISLKDFMKELREYPSHFIGGIEDGFGDSNYTKDVIERRIRHDNPEIEDKELEELVNAKLEKVLKQDIKRHFDL